MVRKLILLSDGTGNSSAKLSRTNVWRTFQALDLAQGAQLAVYDDGVGTSSVKVLAVLGGAFGWGLRRNVLHLYKFLCRNYRAGDEIYGFGFSRGAFTIRVLVGFVLSQGLVRWNSEEELDLLASAAYRAYRAENYRRGLSLAVIGRWIRDLWIGIVNTLSGLKPYTKEPNRKLDSIRFLGLWDTVDAYGMPIKELKVGIDRYVWPLFFENQRLNPRVRQACHALSLDDERATFHPLVWDESLEPREPPDKRIHQVWFPGVHSNVGGGYPDDALSHVPLLWILEHAANAGLRFNSGTVSEYKLAASPYGKMYDSRSGVSSYYRFAPRPVETYQPVPDVHESAYLRMANGSDQYAPISIPAPLAFVAESDLVWDTVWWRRVAYWLMVILTVALVVLGWKELPLGEVDELFRDVVANLATLVKMAVPSFVQPWLSQLTESPAAVALLLVAILGTYMWGKVLAARIADRAAGIWKNRPDVARKVWVEQNVRRWRIAASLAPVLAIMATARAYAVSADSVFITAGFVAVVISAVFFFWRRWFDLERIRAIQKDPPVEVPGFGLRFARLLRNSRVLDLGWRALSNKVFPFLFAVALLYAGAHAINKIAFAAMDIGGVACRQSRAPEALALNQTRTVTFTTNNPCFPTGVLLEKGARYEVEFVNFSGWRDDSIPVNSLDGFSSRARTAPWFMIFAAPMKRHMDENWFKPVAHIGNHSLSERVLDKKSEIVDTTRSGELFLFVNDAVIGLPVIWNYFYRNNQGQATVTIKKIGIAPP